MAGKIIVELSEKTAAAMEEFTESVRELVKIHKRILGMLDEKEHKTHEG